MISVEHYLTVAALLFVIGIFGIFLKIKLYALNTGTLNTGTGDLFQILTILEISVISIYL